MKHREKVMMGTSKSAYSRASSHSELMKEVRLMMILNKNAIEPTIMSSFSIATTNSAKGVSTVIWFIDSNAASVAITETMTIMTETVPTLGDTYDAAPNKPCARPPASDLCCC